LGGSFISGNISLIVQRIKLPEETRAITEEEEIALGFPSKKGMLDLDIYTIDELAERLDITPVTVRNHIKAGRLVSIKFGGPTGHRILRQHIYEWLIGMQTDLIDVHRPAARGKKNISNGNGN